MLWPQELEAPEAGERQKKFKRGPRPCFERNGCAEVPVEERPNVRQLQNQRPSLKSRRGLEFSVDVLTNLRRFVDDPPEGVVVRERM